MHELSLCESVFRSIEEAAEQQGFSQVKKVWLEIGSLASVEIEAMRFCFDVAAKGTVGEQAELIIEEVSPTARCDQCGNTAPVKERFESCPSCGHFPLTLVSGDELRIKELEVE